MQNIEVNKIVAKLTASRELVKKITILKPEKAKFLGNLIDSYIAEIKDLQSKKRSKSTATKSVGFDLSVPNDEKSVENIAAERMARVEKEMNSALTRVEYEVVEVVNPINTNMQAANAVLVQDNARLQRALAAANVEIAANRVEIVRLGGQLAALTARRDQLQHDLGMMDSRYHTAAAARDKLGKNLEVANAEIAANRVDIAANIAEIGRLNEQLAALSAERDALTAERDALLAERDALLTERNALQAQIAANNAAHVAQIQELNRVAEAQAARVQLARLNEQLAATGVQNTQLIQRIAALNGEVQAANARVDAQQLLVEQIRAQLTASQNRVRQLEADLAAARNAAEQAALAAQAELDAARNAAVPNVDDRTLAGQVVELQLFQQLAEEALAAANQRALDQERNHQIQIRFIKGRITQLERINAELREVANQLADANDEHIAMAERNNVREKIVKGINDRVRELLEISENEVTELVGVIQDLQTQLATMRAQLAAAQQANAGGVQDLQNQLATARQQLAAVQERNRVLALEKDANNNTLQANAATIAQNNKTIERLTNRITELENGLRDQRHENKAGKADRADEANRAEGVLKSQISKLQNRLENAQQNYAAAQRRVEKVEHLNRLAATSITNKNQQLVDAAARITELEAQVAAAANNGQLQQQLDAARAEYTAAQAALRQQIEELSNQIRDITDEYQSKVLEIENARRQINAMDASHREELGELSDMLAQERAAYGTLEAQLQAAQQGLANARQTHGNLEKRVTELQRDNQTQRDKFDSLLQQREKEMTNMVQSYEKTIAELTAQVDKDKNSNQQLAEAQRQLAEAQRQLAEAQRQLADCNQIRNELAALNATHAQLLAGVQGKNEQIENLTAHNAELQNRLDVANRELAAERAKPKGVNIDPAVNAEIDQLREKLTADIANVEAQRAQVAAQLAAYLEDKRKLEDQVGELRGLLGVANQERDTANNARDAANTARDAANASNATLQQQLSDLQARLQANEVNQNNPQIAPAELATLQQENAGLRQQIADLEQELTTSKQLNTNLIISMFNTALLLLKKTNTDDSLNNQIVIFERMSDRSITIDTIDEIFTILESRLNTRRAIIKLDSLNERYATLTAQMDKVKNEGHLNWLDQLDVWIDGLEQYEQHVNRKLQEIRTELENTYKNDRIGLRNALAFQEGDNPTIDQYIANYNIFLLNLRRYNEVLKTYITKIRSTKMDNIASLGENSEIIDIIGNFEGIMDALNKYILRVRQKAGKLDRDEDLQERQASFITELRTQVQTAEAQTQEKEVRIAELNTQLEQRAAENTAIRNQIEELQSTIATLKQRETEIETEMRKITGTSAQQLEQLKQLETEKNAVSAELRSVQLQNEGLTRDYREANASNDDLLLELAEITAEKDRATNQLKEITNRNKELEKILDELNTQAAADVRKARAEQAEAAAKVAALAKSEAAAAKSADRADRAAKANEVNNKAPVNLNKPPSNQNEKDDRKAEIAELETRVQKFKELEANYKKLIDNDTKDINEKVKNFIVELNAYTTYLSGLIETINGQINAVANLKMPEVIQTNKNNFITIKTNLINNIKTRLKQATAAKLPGKVRELQNQLAAEEAELAKLQDANQAAPQPNQQVGQGSISTIMSDANIPPHNIKPIDEITGTSTVSEGVIQNIDTYFQDLDKYEASTEATLANTKEKVQQIQTIFIRNNGPEKQLINELLSNLRQISIRNFRTLNSLNRRFIQIRDSYNSIVSYKSKFKETGENIENVSAALAKLQPVVNGKNEANDEAEVKGGYIGGYLDDEVDNTSYSLNTYVPSVIAHSGNMLYIGIIALFAFCVILLIYSMAKYIYKTQFKSEIYYNIHKHKHGRRRSSVGHYDE